MMRGEWEQIASWDDGFELWDALVCEYGDGLGYRELADGLVQVNGLLTRMREYDRRLDLVTTTYSDDLAYGETGRESLFWVRGKAYRFEAVA